MEEENSEIQTTESYSFDMNEETSEFFLYAGRPLSFLAKDTPRATTKNPMERSMAMTNLLVNMKIEEAAALSLVNHSTEVYVNSVLYGSGRRWNRLPVFVQICP
ncbi:uncharacterized protein LOC143857827 [Tasmannia lanceolata]|uniref:uncharacterized protein LOC143857827 n=1 Tax=Tasmannia lanceolata TaxID=3420 RepID=UPI0040632170